MQTSSTKTGYRVKRSIGIAIIVTVALVVSTVLPGGLESPSLGFGFTINWIALSSVFLGVMLTFRYPPSNTIIKTGLLAGGLSILIFSVLALFNTPLQDIVKGGETQCGFPPEPCTIIDLLRFQSWQELVGMFIATTIGFLIFGRVKK